MDDNTSLLKKDILRFIRIIISYEENEKKGF